MNGGWKMGLRMEKGMGMDRGVGMEKGLRMGGWIGMKYLGLREGERVLEVEEQKEEVDGDAEGLGSEGI